VVVDSIDFFIFEDENVELAFALFLEDHIFELVEICGLIYKDLILIWNNLKILTEVNEIKIVCVSSIE